MAKLTGALIASLSTVAYLLASFQLVSSFQTKSVPFRDALCLSAPLPFKEQRGLGASERTIARNSDSVRCPLQSKYSEESFSTESFFFVRVAVFADLSAAARILTDGFFSDSTNFITYQMERLKTFLSLESTFPDPINRGSHEMIVACLNQGSKVVGFAEVDCRESDDPKLPPRPYMCNLCVDKKWQRKGVATVLIKECESISIRGGKDSIFLKVREGNFAATSMYESIGYVIVSSSQEDNDVVLLMKKDLREAAVGSARQRDSVRNEARLRLPA